MYSSCDLGPSDCFSGGLMANSFQVRAMETRLVAVVAESGIRLDIA